MSTSVGRARPRIEHIASRADTPGWPPRAEIELTPEKPGGWALDERRDWHPFTHDERCDGAQAVFLLPFVRDEVADIAGVDDEDGEQSRRFGRARVLADGVVRARGLAPVLARVEHLRLAIIHLASD